MSDEDSIAIEAAKALGAVVPEAYRDLLQPAARELGQSLLVVAKTVNVALSPLSATVWGFDRIRDWLLATLTRKLSKTPVGQIQTPPRQIAGQVLLNLQFVIDEEYLREMYANLLASAMDSSSAGKAHPAYVSILQQISSDEARLLSFLGKLPREELSWAEQHEEGMAKSIPIEGKWLYVCSQAGVVNLENAGAYLDNLLRLRIFTADLISTASLESRFLVYGDSSHEMSLREGTIREVYLSDFGSHFIEVCIAEKDKPAGAQTNGEDA
ncbi:MAG TPA: DUF4393 domain-containing protein [Thermoanaerobaculia bacterium]|nr:DUF4393 domain-containing protein [Thermoanaerobaculia bacterium]